MPSEFLLNKANAVLENLPPNKDGSKDIDVLAIASLILKIASLFTACIDKPKSAAMIANDPPLYYRRRVKKIIKDEVGRDVFRKRGDEVFDGVMALGFDATEDDIKKLITETEHQDGKDFF